MALSGVVLPSAAHSQATPLEVLKYAVQGILKDETFQFPSSNAKKSLKDAEKYLEWISFQPEAASLFASCLTSKLQACFVGGQARKIRSRREKMWETFYKLTTTTEFIQFWETHLRSVNITPARPSFFQHITDQVMKDLIALQLSIDKPASTSDGPSDGLDYEEKNGLRYTAGYIIGSLIKKLKSSKHVQRDELTRCLSEMVENNIIDRAVDDESEDWMFAIDRGGLKHIKDEAYMLFVSMEAELRKHLTLTPEGTDISICKNAIIQYIMSDEEVLFYWSIISFNWDDDTADTLLHKLTEHWMTVRGFSHTRGFMEKFKQKHQKSLEKSKGIRKTLVSASTKKACNDPAECGKEE